MVCGGYERGVGEELMQEVVCGCVGQIAGRRALL